MNNDLISRQAAIDKVVKESQVDGAYGYMDTKSLIDLLKGLPSAQPKQRWVPCSERPPEKCGWYMCTLKDYRVNTYYWNNKGEWIDNGKKHFFELYNISSRYTGEDITAEQEGSVYWTDWVIAWMPPPEPYRKEGKTE